MFPGQREFLMVLAANLFCGQMRSMGFVFTRQLSGTASFRIRGQSVCRKPIDYRLFSESKLDDLMDDVDQMLADLSTQNQPSSDEKRWSSLDWSNTTLPSSTKPSPVEQISIRDRNVYIKRDDNLKLHGSQVSGNKARKMLTMNEIPAAEFPSYVVSYGGPQSNAMLALAAVVNYKNRQLTEGTTEDQNDASPPSENPPESKKRFRYYTKKLPRFLRNQPSGNFFRAQLLGMELMELTPTEYRELFESDWGGRPDPPLGLDPPVPGDSLWVPQGGACGMAAGGAKVLAGEIASFWSENGQGRPLSVILPGGTCSTAVLVHHGLQKLLHDNLETSMDIQVVVIPCVGDDAYARRQMMSLSLQLGESADDIPIVLAPAPDESLMMKGSAETDYFSFGEPMKEILDTFQMMKEDHGVVLDLLYGASAWTILLRHWDSQLSADLSFDPNNPIAGREIMYVHSGGLEGINSQLLRYKYKGLVADEDIQLPGRDRRIS